MGKISRAKDNAVRCWWDEDNGCYDLEVLDPGPRWRTTSKRWARDWQAPDAIHKYSGNCIGCGICCGGRLPLTAADLYRLQKGGLGMALPLDEWVSAYGSVQRQGGCFDITLTA